MIKNLPFLDYSISHFNRFSFSRRKVCFMAAILLGSFHGQQSSATELKNYVNNMQQVVIRGKITDMQHNSLEGVSIYYEGSRNATKSDANGNFQIEVNTKTTGALRFTLIGYKETRLSLNGQDFYTVQLEPETKVLDEIVTVGYAREKKINLTGAVASVDAKVLEDRPLTNLGRGLQGAIGNLTVGVGNGAPGNGSSFNVRGLTSVNGGGPLILVDGAQVNPNMINPADVESVTVLKDAASASIYGTQAAYEVILITTKKGKDGPAKVSVQSNVSVNSPLRVPQYVNSWEFVNFHNETNKNSGGGATITIKTIWITCMPTLQTQGIIYQSFLIPVIPINTFMLVIQIGLRRHGRKLR